MFCSGALTAESHLFPFRTEKLSPLVLMIVLTAKVSRRQNITFNSKKVQNSHRNMAILRAILTLTFWLKWYIIYKKYRVVQIR